MRNVHKLGVLLVDDHVPMRYGLRKLLEADPRIAVVGEAATARAPSKLHCAFAPT